MAVQWAEELLDCLVAPEFSTLSECKAPDVPDLPFPYPMTWLVMIDDHPLANWGHPCRWVFVRSDLRAHKKPLL